MKWLHPNIATSAFDEATRSPLDPDTSIVDVRDLVDKAGNDTGYVNDKIEEALEHIKRKRRVIICCDYGMSRSNSIAIGVLVKWLNISFPDAVSIAKKSVEESDIKIEMLNTVYAALFGQNGADTSNKKIGNICITGSNGFLGRNLARALSPGFQLSCPPSREINLKDDIVALDMLVKSSGIDCIVHLANPKIVTHTESMGDTLVMLKNVLDVCRTNQVKLVYLSGWEIYSGYRSATLLADEKLPPNPKGTYGETKWFCELLIKQYADIYGVDFQIIRSGPVYGVGAERPKFIFNFIDKARENRKIVTHKYVNGSPSLDLLHIDDLMTFMVKCIPSAFSGEINIGSGTIISTFEIARMIADLTASNSEIEQVQINDYSANIQMDNRNASNLFAWTPNVKVKKGLEEILQSYKV